MKVNRNALAIGLFFFCYLIAQMYSHKVLFSIPSDADETFFEGIAFNLSQGSGFSGQFSDAIKKPYLDSFGPKYLDPYILEVSALGLDSTTTYRPPLFSTLLGILYFLFGRHFFLAKLLNAALLAGGVGLLASAAQRLCGRWTSVCNTLGRARYSVFSLRSAWPKRG